MLTLVVSHLPYLVLLVSLSLSMQVVQVHLGRYHLGHLVAGLISAYGLGMSFQDREGTGVLAIMGLCLLLLLVHVLLMTAFASFATSELFMAASLGWLLMCVFLVQRQLLARLGGDAGLVVRSSSLGEVTLGTLVLVLGCMLALAMRRLGSSSLVLALKAYRDNRSLYRHLKLPVVVPITTAFLVSSFAYAPFPPLQAIHLGIVLPEFFSIDTAFIAVLALELVGRNSWLGGIIGPALVVALKIALDCLDFGVWLVPTMYLALLLGVSARARLGTFTADGERLA